MKPRRMSLSQAMRRNGDLLVDGNLVVKRTKNIRDCLLRRHRWIRYQKRLDTRYGLSKPWNSNRRYILLNFPLPLWGTEIVIIVLW